MKISMSISYPTELVSMTNDPMPIVNQDNEEVGRLETTTTGD